MTSQWRHRNKTHTWYSELNSLQNVYFEIFTFWKLTEWRRFVTYLWNDPRIKIPVTVCCCYLVFIHIHCSRSIFVLSVHHQSADADCDEEVYHGVICVERTSWRYSAHRCFTVINPSESRGNYSATSNNMKFVHWPLTGTFGTVRMGLGGTAARSSLYQM